MSTEIKNLWLAVKALLKAYPHIVAYLINLAVVIGASFGWHLTPDQVIALASSTATAVTLLVHLTMVAKAKVPAHATPVAVAAAVAPEVEQAAEAVAPVVAEVEVLAPGSVTRAVK